MRFVLLSAFTAAICACARAATAAENELSVVDPAKAGWNTATLDELAAYAQSQGTTGFLIIQDRKVIYEHNWPLPPTAAAFAANFTHGTDVHGALQEDVMFCSEELRRDPGRSCDRQKAARYFEACL